MTGYVRQSAADIVPTAVVRAAPINNELNALRDAFEQSNGHKHDGTAAEGHYVPLIADDDANNKVAVDTSNNRVGIHVEVAGAAVEQVRVQDGAIVPVTDNDIDLGTSANEFKDLYIDGTANIDSLVADTADINGGTVDATVIGASTPAAATVTNLTVNSAATIASADINAGTIDGAVIGSASAQTVTGTTITATVGFVGGLTGNVTGNVTGNTAGTHTGAVIGDVTGNITSSGTSTFNNVTVTGTLNMDAGTTGTITNLSTPTNSGDAATKGYVDAADALKLNKAGDTMTGALAMSANKITGVGTPTATTDAATKGYVDTADALKLNLSGGTMSGAIAMGTNKITGVGTPTDTADAATKGYVDTSIANLIDAAPATLDTLNELAAALGDDPNFATTVTNSIATKVSKAGDTMTGALAMSANKITGVGTPTDTADAATKGYVDTADALKLNKAGDTMTGALAMSTNKITGVGDPTSAQDAATKNYVDTQDATKLSLSGGTMTGAIAMGTNKLTGVGDPTLAQDAATKNYVDTADATKLSLSGGTMSGDIAMGTNKLTGVGDPTLAQDAATKNYVDAQDATKLSLSGGTMTGNIVMGANKVTSTATPTTDDDLTRKGYVDSILGSATSAAASAAAAAISESNAAGSASAASTSASNAASSASAAAASYDEFDDRYLGSKTADPTLDNDGNALITGALYFNSVAGEMRVWTGSAWLAAYLPATGYATLTGTETLTNKTISGSDNTITNVSLTTGVTGTLPIANGGTGQTTQTAAFDALAPTTTKGDLIVSNGSDNVRLAVGTNDYVLTADSTAATGLAWKQGTSATLTIQNKTGAYTVVAGDLGTIINCTSGTFTVSLTAAATLGAGFNVTIWNTSTTSTDAITIDPNGSETIDGKTTIILRRNEGVQIICDGTNWQTGNKKAMRAYAENIANAYSRPVASGDTALALGAGATASGTESFAAGRGVTASANFSAAIATNSAGNGSQAVTGSGAMALGGSYASGTDSFAAAVANNTSSYGAKGANSIAMGDRVTASASRSVAIGSLFTVASGANALALGNSEATSTNAISICASNSNYRGTASANGAVAIGWGRAAASYPIAQAEAAIALQHGISSVKGKLAFGYDNVGWLGQFGVLNLRSTTTSATPATLTTDTSATADSTNQIILPNNSAYAFSILIVARQQAAGGTASAAWKIEGLIRREANAASTTLVNSATTVLNNDPGWAVAVSADTTNGGLAVTVTGAAATNIRWVATGQTSEVTYA